jgi:hypothetical protein
MATPDSKPLAKPAMVTPESMPDMATPCPLLSLADTGSSHRALSHTSS